MEQAISKARVLIEALPYIKQFHKKVFCIKYGGSILQDTSVRESVLTDIAFLRYAGIYPILVHGGGPHINQRLQECGHPVRFADGIRVTDKVTLDIVVDEMTLLNRRLVDEINRHGAIARGFVGNTTIIRSSKKTGTVDLGFVGKPCGHDSTAVSDALQNAIPVIAPMGVDENGAYYNINADDVAYYLATALQAEKLVFFTKELGIMRDISDDTSLISTIRAGDAEQLIDDEIIAGGMIPKVRASVQSLHGGVGKVHIVDAKIPHALLLEIFTDTGIGTEIIH